LFALASHSWPFAFKIPKTSRLDGFRWFAAPIGPKETLWRAAQKACRDPEGIKR
jgi:hypothetical protein